MNERIPKLWTQPQLTLHLRSLDLVPGDSVMIHAAMRSVGPLLDGPDTLIRALLEVIGADGTLLAYTDWDAPYHELLVDGLVPDRLRNVVAPFDPGSSRAIRSHGILAEFVRTWPGAARSANAGASVAAIGGRSSWFVGDHALDYGYGPRSPFAKLVEARGKVLMVGAPLDTMTILHHAEHIARIAGKRIVKTETPLLINGKREWRIIEESDTSQPIVAGLDDGYFGTVVKAFLETGKGNRGSIGNAPSILVSAPEIVAFAVAWLEERFSPTEA